MTSNEDFFLDLYSETEGGYLSTWEKQDKTTTWHPINDIEKVMKRALELSSSGKDAYFGVCPRRTAIYEEKNGWRYAVRGGESDVHSVPALWIDIDIQEPGAHAKHELPASKDEALSFLDEIPLKPSYIIFSGYGLHVYWLLREPIVINNSRDLSMAKNLSSGWGAYIRNLAQQRHGCNLDNVSDLARVLRVPGTYNYKKAESPSLVEIIGDTVARYDPSDFSDYTLSERNPKVVRRASLAAPDVIPEGSRNDTMFKRGSSRHANGLSGTELEMAMLADNATLCNPPLSEGEVLTIARSINKYAPGTSAEQQTALALATLNELGEDWDDITSDVTLDVIFSIQDEVERQRQISKLREKAKKLGRTRDFNDIMRAWSNKLELEKKSIESVEELYELKNDLLPGAHCPGYVSTENGGILKGFISAEGNPLGEVISQRLILITGIMENIETGERVMEISFRRSKDDIQWDKIQVSRAVIASKQQIVGLAAKGFPVTSETAPDIVSYLSRFEEANREIIPYHRSVSHLGWDDSEKFFVPYSDGVVCDEADSFRENIKAVCDKGDFRKWLEVVQSARNRSMVIRAVIAAVFASPLLKLIGKLIFFVHLWGRTGSGKSVAMRVGASIFGDSEVLVRSFDATQVGMERVAAFMHNLPLFLDELQALRRDKVDLSGLLYALGGGRSRGMGRREGGVVPDKHWSNIILTNGEVPLASELPEGGAMNRVIDLKADGKLIDDPYECVAIIKQNYGMAGKMFITGLMDELNEKGKGPLQAMYDKIHEKHLGAGTDKQVDSLSALALGEYYAGRLVFGLGDEEAWNDSCELADYLSKNVRSDRDVDVVGMAWDEVMDWVAIHNNFFEKNGAVPIHDVYGKFENGGQEVLVSSAKVKEVLNKAGFSLKKSVDGWLERGWIEGGREGNKEVPSVRTRFSSGGTSGSSEYNSMQTRCYKFITTKGPYSSVLLDKKEVETSLLAGFDPF